MDKEKLHLISKITLVAAAFAIPISIAGTNILIVLTALFSILSGQFSKNFSNLIRHPVVILILLFFSLALLSAVYSGVAWPDASQGLHKYSKLLFIPLLLPLINAKAWLDAVINAFLLAMLLTLLLAYFKFFGWLEIGEPLNPGAVFKNHIETSFFMAFAAFILLQRSLQVSRWRWAYGLLLLLALYYLFFINASRTGYLVFAGLAILFLWQQFKWRGLLATAIALPLLALTLWQVSPTFNYGVSAIQKDLQNYNQAQLAHNSIGLRLTFAKKSWQLFKEKPLFGHGIGSFKTLYAERFGPEPGFPVLSDPHNEYLLVAVQLGFLGLSTLLLLFLLQWYLSFDLPREYRVLAQALLVIFTLGALCDSLLYLSTTGYFFVLFNGLFTNENKKPYPAANYSYSFR